MLALETMNYTGVVFDPLTYGSILNTRLIGCFINMTIYNSEAATPQLLVTSIEALIRQRFDCYLRIDIADNETLEVIDELWEGQPFAFKISTDSAFHSKEKH